MSFISGILDQDTYFKLPVRCWGLKDIPGVPFSVRQALRALPKLGLREQQTKQAKSALSNTYTIGRRTASGYQFMYQHSEDTTKHASDLRHDRLGSKFHIINIAKIGSGIPSQFLDLSPQRNVGPLTSLSLDKPKQWTMSWTTFPNVYEAGEEMRETWIRTLTCADTATEQFWPTIANYGLAYNLLVLQKVGMAKIDSIKKQFQSVWRDEFDEWHQAGKLYMIDFSIFDVLEAHEVEGSKRFTPSTITLLRQNDDEDKTITPVAVRVAGYKDAAAQIYSRENATDSAWLYALQAAKTSATVYGIWLGHVYHWHMVTATMQMTMYNTLPTDHVIHQLLAPQSNYLIGFNTVLFALWKEIAPPTSINTSREYLKLCDVFASGREYFDDDPKKTLDRLELNPADFTKDKPWDLYPIVRHYLDVWEATKEYVDQFVDHTYPHDRDVRNDKKLQKWIKKSGNKRKGNIKGLPDMDSKDDLKEVLTSLIYRITMHGGSRLASDALPAFTFVANYPPCLQESTIPTPESNFDTKELLSYLPKTGTIGEMMNFYFLFVFSAPYEPFIPLYGVESNLFFGKDPEDPRNKALINYRNKVIEVIKDIGSIEDSALIHQVPLNIET